MKTKVLMYKNDGNNLKDVVVDLSEVCKNVYYFVTPDTYGDVYHIVFDYKGIFFQEGVIHSEKLALSVTPEMYNNWIQNNLSEQAVLNPAKYTNNLNIEVLQRSGVNESFLKSVIENKKKYLDNKEAEEKAKAEERRKKEAEEKRLSDIQAAADLKEAERAYKACECISPRMFAELCKNAGIELRPNTKGRLFDERKTSKVTNCSIYERQKLPYFAGFFEAANKLNHFYNI